MPSLLEVIELRASLTRDLNLNPDDNEVVMLWNGDGSCIAVMSTPLDDGTIVCEFAFFVDGQQVPIIGLAEEIRDLDQQGAEIGQFEIRVPHS